jgi:two-component system, sensor histidine kinase LadS
LEQLIWQNKNLEEFAYVVSHNLRSPVSSLLGLTQLAKTHPDEPETIRDILEKISTVSHSLDQVIKDLNTALTVQQKQTLNKEAIDLIELLHEIQNILQPELEHCEVDFKTTLEVNALVSVRSYLHNILYNLVHNAIKYRHPDRKPSISISSRLTDEGVQLQVEDNGLGLDAERIGEKLFGLYQRFHLHVPGKGIGLYLVKSQVEALGGSITVRSKPDEGSTFTVLLP